MKKLILILMMITTASAVYAATAQDVIAGLKKINTYSAEFVQTTEIEGFGEDQYSGKLFINRGKGALWDYDKPYRQFYLFDTSTMKYYDSETKQVVVQKLDPSTNVFMRLMLSPEDIEKDFSVTLNGSELHMMPKGDLGIAEIVFIVKNGVVAGIRTKDQNGNNTNIELKNISIDKELPKRVFAPEVPVGTEIFYY